MISKKIIIVILLIALIALTGCLARLQDKGLDGNNAADGMQPDGTMPSSGNIQEEDDGVHMPGEEDSLGGNDTGEDKPQGNDSGENPVEENGSGENPADETDPIAEQIKAMTLEEKIGQMVIVGLDGHEVDNNALAMIEDHHVGGFILFGHNIESADQLLALVNSLKRANSKNRIPLFVSVDQEGGRVSRMPEGIEKFPSSKAIGQINDSSFCYEIGYMLAEAVKAFGFNMNFAPVLDVNSNPQNPVIGDRSFGADAEVVARLGVQTMKGIRAGGVIPVVKHFPGHGDTLIDSHIGLPSIDHDMDRLEKLELVPFSEAIGNQADAVMIAHILMRKIDGENPASLSKKIITDILRKQMNFNGVVITDDLTMGAITKNYNIGDAAVKSVNAGADIALVCHGNDNMVAVINALKKAAEDGTIPIERVDESVYRILKLKNAYGLQDNIIDSIDVEQLNNRIRSVLSRYFLD